MDRWPAPVMHGETCLSLPIQFWPQHCLTGLTQAWLNSAFCNNQQTMTAGFHSLPCGLAEAACSRLAAMTCCTI
jgi:hypothetical protein